MGYHPAKPCLPHGLHAYGGLTMHANEEPIAQGWLQAFAWNPPSGLKAVCFASLRFLGPPLCSFSHPCSPASRKGQYIMGKPLGRSGVSRRSADTCTAMLVAPSRLILFRLVLCLVSFVWAWVGGHGGWVKGQGKGKTHCRRVRFAKLQLKVLTIWFSFIAVPRPPLCSFSHPCSPA